MSEEKDTKRKYRCKKCDIILDNHTEVEHHLMDQHFTDFIEVVK